MERLVDVLSGGRTSMEATFEDRLFRALTLLGAAVAFLVVLPLNHFQQLFPVVNLLVALLGLGSLVIHLLARRGLNLPGTYFALLLGMLDLIWFGNAGSEGSIGYFFLLVALFIPLFFQGWRRYAGLGLYLLNGSALFLVERAWPHLVTRFPDHHSRFVDLMGSFLVCSVIAVLALWLVLGGYQRERERQQRTAEALQTSEGRFRGLVEEAPIPMLEAGEDGRILWLNRAFRELLGYTLVEIPDAGAWFQKAYPDPAYRAQAEADWAEATARSLREAQPVPPSVYQVIGSDGTAHPLEIQAARVQDRWLVMFTDLTARRQAEEAMRERERQLLQTQEAGRVGTFAWDIRADRWVSSPVLDRILGIPPDFVYDLAHWNGLIRPDFRGPMAQYVEGLLRHRRDFDQEYPVVRPLDGEERWVHGRAEFEFDETGMPCRMVGTIQDITEAKRAERERRALEQQVLRAQKMESLGSLAGGIAHDMNNVLGAILAMASARQARELEGSSAWSALETITKACVRGRTLVQGLLDFSRQELAEERDLDLNALVRDQLRVLEHTTLGKVEVEAELAEDVRCVRGDGAALSHALMNLCVNALDAMPDGGLLRIRSRNLDDATVELEVRDTGCGMSPEVLAKALDPFFTTKPVGKGTGLGLPLVYATARAHGGEVRITSEPGRGTSVVLHFPAAGPRPQAAVEEAPSTSQARGRRILLVDDDPLIRESFRALLELSGHTVEEVDCGEVALAWLESGGEADGVVLDLNMPGLGGEGTLQRLRAGWPELPVLLATGRPDQTALDLVAAYPKVALLPKPFSLRELRLAMDAWDQGNAEKP